MQTGGQGSVAARHAATRRRDLSAQRRVARVAEDWLSTTLEMAQNRPESVGRRLACLLRCRDVRECARRSAHGDGGRWVRRRSIPAFARIRHADSVCRTTAADARRRIGPAPFTAFAGWWYTIYSLSLFALLFVLTSSLALTRRLAQPDSQGLARSRARIRGWKSGGESAHGRQAGLAGRP
jgi:hypothetical protein